MADEAPTTPNDTPSWVDAFKGGTARRIYGLLAAALVPIINQRLNLGLSETVVEGWLGVCAVYLAQSVANEMHARHVEAKVTTFDQAAKDLGAKP